MTAAGRLDLAAALGCSTHIWADARSPCSYLVTRTPGPIGEAAPEVWVPSVPDRAIGEARLAAVSAMIRDRLGTIAYVAPYIESLRRHLSKCPAPVEATASRVEVSHVLVGVERSAPAVHRIAARHPDLAPRCAVIETSHTGAHRLYLAANEDRMPALLLPAASSSDMTFFAGWAEALFARIPPDTLGDPQTLMRLREIASAAGRERDCTGERPGRVAHLARMLAAHLGATERYAERVALAGHLTDLGMASIPRGWLTAPDPDPAQKARIQMHPRYGAALLDLARVDDRGIVRDAVLHHCERQDGHGHPDGLSGYGIPFAAHVVSVAACFDDLTHHSEGGEALMPEVALEHISSCIGTRFLAEVAEGFVRMVGDILQRPHARDGGSAGPLAPTPNAKADAALVSCTTGATQ